MALTYTPYKGMDVKIQIASGGTNHIYTLSPGCTITRSVSKLVTPLTGNLGGAQNVMTLGQIESDTIRIDAKVSTVVMQTPDGSADSPPYVDVHTLFDHMIAQVNGDAPDLVEWGSKQIWGRVKSIVVTQRPGEGNVVDLAITFVVGTAIEST